MLKWDANLMHFCFSSLGRNGVRKNLKAKYCKRTTSLLQIITIVRNIQHKPHKFDFQIFPIVISIKNFGQNIQQMKLFFIVPSEKSAAIDYWLLKIVNKKHWSVL